jgi:hypothetical protein
LDASVTLAVASNGLPPAVERHYAPPEVGELWQLDSETIRRLFGNEPGVIVLEGPARKGKRSYKTIRIP